MNTIPMRAFDRLFLLGESRHTMMHVAGMMVFTKPEDAAPDFMSRLGQRMKDSVAPFQPWNLRPTLPESAWSPRNRWEEVSEVDVDYHIRRLALPSPGDERELGVLISRLHSNPLDMSRPLWEVYLIEGLEGNRFAIYTKIHHALMDGYSAVRAMGRSLATDAADHGRPFFFSLPPERTSPSKYPAIKLDIGHLSKAPGAQLKSSLDAFTAFRRFWQRDRNESTPDVTSSWQAPMTILNQRIGRNRRYATQQAALSDVRAVAKQFGGTLNDVVVAMCAGGLRRYLIDQGELPSKPLVALVPVNIRPKDDPGGGNAVGTILMSMATDLEDPIERLQAIIASGRAAKAQLEGLSAAAIMQYSAMLATPFGAQAALASLGIRTPLPLAWNVIISNVRGSDVAQFVDGARLDAFYPVSIPTHGNALNITLQSHDGMLNFGFVGCRDTVPSLQKLAVFTGQALRELQQIEAPAATLRKLKVSEGVAS